MKVTVVLVSVFVCISWSANAQFDANCQDNRRTIVHLFEWRWDDIAEECERFLGPKGFCGVQVSPPNEHRIVNTVTVKRPWWERYQPVSYKISTRSGDEVAFKDMIKRCNDVGVRIYVDAILNHMAGETAGGSNGTGGTPFNTFTLDFPGVPYISNDFHQKEKDCKTASGTIESFTDAEQVRNCRLDGLVDLNQSKGYVRQKMIKWLNKMISWGIAGFRIDAAKHILPADLELIINELETLSTQWFAPNSRPFIYQEVIDHGDEPIKSAEYFGIGRVTEFNYGLYLGEAFIGRKQLTDLKKFGPEYGYLMPSDKALVFIDNHDNQRGHGSGKPVLTFFKPRQYKMAVTFMLAWPYGQARLMSSYRWEPKMEGGKDRNDWMGPPADEQYNTKPVTIDSDGNCENDWVCEHRWKAITSMVQFRNVAGDEEVRNWWDNGANHIAFSRGNKAFYAVNAGIPPLSKTLQTGLSPGRYCDVISGERSEDWTYCTGKTITVGSDGTAMIAILENDANPIIAIHVESMLGDKTASPETSTAPTTLAVETTQTTTETITTRTTTVAIATHEPTTTPKTKPTTASSTTLAPTTKATTTTKKHTTAIPTLPVTTTTTAPITTTTTPSPFRRTVVFIERKTISGQDLFLRGGLNRPGCDDYPSVCWIPIKYNHISYNTKHYAGYNTWSQGDTSLNWSGREITQIETFNNKKADGSPMAWTTNSPQSDNAYSVLNTYGPHFWMLDVMMDCSTTVDGWFELKGILNGGWEQDIRQDRQCKGDAGVDETPAFAFKNHVAKCGFRNVFTWNGNGCQIDNLNDQ